VLLERRDDVIRDGKQSGLEAGIDQLPVPRHLERAPSACRQLDVLSKFLLDCGGQTDRPRLVTSSRAVFDADRHEKWISRVMR
jgi:hypothetical protein